MLLLKNGPVAKVCMSASYQLGNLDWSSIETVVPNDLIVGPILEGNQWGIVVRPLSCTQSEHGEKQGTEQRSRPSREARAGKSAGEPGRDA